VVHWYLRREGKLEITDYRENAARQSGIYSASNVSRTRGCRALPVLAARTRSASKKPYGTWDSETPLEMDRGDGEIPCPEPCSVFVSFAGA
jgi:hypothetical protein